MKDIYVIYTGRYEINEIIGYSESEEDAKKVCVKYNFENKVLWNKSYSARYKRIPLMETPDVYTKEYYHYGFYIIWDDMVCKMFEPPVGREGEKIISAKMGPKVFLDFYDEDKKSGSCTIHIQLEEQNAKKARAMAEDEFYKALDVDFQIIGVTKRV